MLLTNVFTFLLPILSVKNWFVALCWPTFLLLQKHMSVKLCRKCLPKKMSSLLFQCMDEIALVLTDIVNDISSAFPQVLCQTRWNGPLSPLQNKASPDPNILKNLRPVSNCLLCQNCWKSCPFSAACTPRTTVCGMLFSRRVDRGTALPRVFNDLLTSNDSDHISTLTLLGLSAAFDTTDHDRLLNHLRDVFCIHDTALAFFESYPSGRKQVVSILGRESEPSSFLYGVPRSSILGPITSVLYTHSIWYHWKTLCATPYVCWWHGVVRFSFSLQHWFSFLQHAKLC